MILEPSVSDNSTESVGNGNRGDLETSKLDDSLLTTGAHSRNKASKKPQLKSKRGPNAPRHLTKSRRPTSAPRFRNPPRSSSSSGRPPQKREGMKPKPKSDHQALNIRSPSRKRIPTNPRHRSSSPTRKRNQEQPQNRPKHPPQRANILRPSQSQPEILPEVPILSPGRQSTKLTMSRSPDPTPQRVRPISQADGVPTHGPLSPARTTVRQYASINRSQENSYSKQHLKQDGKGGVEGDSDDDEMAEFAFERASMHCSASMPKMNVTTISDSCDLSIDSFHGPSDKKSEPSFWDLQESSHGGTDDPFSGPIKHPPPNRSGLLRSLSTLMVAGGGTAGKSSRCSSASVGFELENRPSTRATSIGLSGSTHQRCTMSVVRPVDRRRIETRSGKSRSASLSFEPSHGQPGTLRLPGNDDECSNKSRRRNSSSSLPDERSAISSSQESFLCDRNCIVLDIRREPSGEPEENTDGYRIVHLITDFTNLSIWDAVREAHRNYPENRLFKADSTLEQALQSGSKRGMLVISGPVEKEGEPLEIKQSFDYWKTKDFHTTVDALVPSHKQYLSIQIEYANVLQAIEGEKDLFDQF